MSFEIRMRPDDPVEIIEILPSGGERVVGLLRDFSNEELSEMLGIEIVVHKMVDLVGHILGTSTDADGSGIENEVNGKV